MMIMETLAIFAICTTIFIDRLEADIPVIKDRTGWEEKT